MKRFIEYDIHEQEVKKLKQEFEDTYNQIEEKAIEIIDKMKEEIQEKDNLINDLIERMVYYSTFFGRGFEVAKNLYEEEKLFNQVYTVVNDFTGEIYNFNEELVQNTTQEMEDIQENEKDKEINTEKLDENNEQTDSEYEFDNSKNEDINEFDYINFDYLDF
jgi:hypothetical protein